MAEETQPTTKVPDWVVASTATPPATHPPAPDPEPLILPMPPLPQVDAPAPAPTPAVVTLPAPTLPQVPESPKPAGRPVPVWKTPPPPIPDLPANHEDPSTIAAKEKLHPEFVPQDVVAARPRVDPEKIELIPPKGNVSRAKPDGMSRFDIRVRYAIARLQKEKKRVTGPAVMKELGIKDAARVYASFKKIGFKRDTGFVAAPEEEIVFQKPQEDGTMKLFSSGMFKMSAADAMELAGILSCRVLSLGVAALKRMENIIVHSADEHLVCAASSCCVEWGRMLVRLNEVVAKRAKGAKSKLETAFVLVDQQESALVGANGHATVPAPEASAAPVIDRIVTPVSMPAERLGFSDGG